MGKWSGIINHYRDYMPVDNNTQIISLQEGNTPLIFAKRISQELGIELYLKYDGTNPTGSFKDRGMALAVTKAVADGDQAIMCASTGNTSAAAAAYGARAGLNVYVVIPEGKIAYGKLSQALIHGAKVLPIRGNFDEALEIVKEITENYPITLVNSLNPYRIEGQKSAAFEICDQLGKAPDLLGIPVGNAGNITAYWQGFQEYHANNVIKKLPEMRGFEAEGAAAIVKDKIIQNPETIATAIRIGNPASWEKAVNAARSSSGAIDFVNDAEIISAYHKIANLEGVFAEPASAASVAGLYKMKKENTLAENLQAVAVLTGHGLKDPDVAVDQIELDEVYPANVKAILKQLNL